MVTKTQEEIDARVSRSRQKFQEMQTKNRFDKAKRQKEKDEVLKAIKNLDGFKKFDISHFRKVDFRIACIPNSDAGSDVNVLLSSNKLFSPEEIANIRDYVGSDEKGSFLVSPFPKGEAVTKIRVEFEDGTVKYGYSLCSKDDNFQRSVGIVNAWIEFNNPSKSFRLRISKKIAKECIDFFNE